MTDTYVTGAVIKRLREKKNLTQEELAQKIFVTSKAVSKWETGRGFPDISLLEPLAKALGISIIELLSGDYIQNTNKAANMMKAHIYVCPVCGNVIHSCGESLVSCCGIPLPSQDAELPDIEHAINVQIVEDEYFVSVNHSMTKEHYISFLMAVSGNKTQFVKLYPEQNAEARFKIDGVTSLYAYCNRHGLFKPNRMPIALPRISL